MSDSPGSTTPSATPELSRPSISTGLTNKAQHRLENAVSGDHIGEEVATGEENTLTEGGSPASSTTV